MAGGLSWTGEAARGRKVKRNCEKKLWRNMSSLASPSLPFLVSEKLAVLELFD